MDCPRLNDCPLSSPLLLDAARTYLASRYCPPGHGDCALRQAHGVGARAGEQPAAAPALVGAGRHRAR